MIPQTLVIGYAANEQTVPKDYATRVCNQLAELGAAGVTIIVASEDGGVGAGDCLTNDGNNMSLFQPTFPASCPFVTTVGATSGVAPEVAASFSGGGFSRYFDRPSYQNQAVSAYLAKLGNRDAGKFSPAGRAYPDVAALADGYQVVVNGQIESVSEAAAGAYAFASVVSLLNDARLKAGKSSLGFLNPFLYSALTAGLNDITSGSNPGCGTNGFTAGPGWDPITGLGTPDFGNLKELLLP
ncbi:hypothetical protein BGZ93_000543 [Podila epicladia]|nr:hypothetical protein BGZ93_000543 [Podila epicladia]